MSNSSLEQDLKTYQDLLKDGVMDWTYDYTNQNQPGNVAMMAQLPTSN